MTLFLVMLAIVWLIGLNVMSVGLWNAPEAYEDEAGFHVVWKNNVPEARDVACIWPDPAQPAVMLAPAHA